MIVKKNLSKIEIYRTAVFGATWGIIEITIGNALHISKVPFRGFFLSLIAAVILVTAKNLTNFRGSLILVGIVCATVKTATSGVFLINPIIAILFESIVAELVFIVIRIRPLDSFLAGSMILFYTFNHSLLAQLFFFGLDIVDVYQKTFSAVFSLNETNINFAATALGLYGIAHLLMGGIAGLAGYRYSKRVSMHMELMLNEKVS